MFKYGKLLVLALGLCVNATGCDQPGSEDCSDQEDTSFRSGGLGTGLTLTLNTNQWVSSAARDVFEFSMHAQWHKNSYDYEIKLEEITVPVTPYGEVSSEVGPPPPSDEAWVEILPGEEFGARVHGPEAGDPVYDLTGSDIIGLELQFEVKGLGGAPHPVAIEFVGHHADASAGDFYEIHKVHPMSGEMIAPLCEEDIHGQRLAKVYDGLSVDGKTGAMDFVGQGIHHFACTSSAPGKAIQFGYDPAEVPMSDFMLANRIIRADYCADGHPYTYPGNLVAMEDNVSPGQQGKTLADVYANLGVDQALEAVWDKHGVLCMDDPRADHVERDDIVCPIKRFKDGSFAYNWRPPSCTSWVDPSPASRRFFSKTEI